jgi:methionyl-tRNA formyltransferase
MREAAEVLNIPVIAPESVNSEAAIQALAELRPDLLVVCDYGQILKPAALGVAPLGGINLHGSLLPKYRGAAPLNWAIWNGDHETGVTVIHMTPKLDGGPMLAIRKTPIGYDETAVELEVRLSQMGIEPVHESIALLTQWDRVSTIGAPQDPSLTTTARRLTKADGAIDWKNDAVRIRNQIRALKPWPGTYSYWQRAQGEPLRVILDWVSLVDFPQSNAAPGEVVHCDGKSLWIATGKGGIAVDRIQPAGKRVMNIDEFLKGYKVVAGDRFGPGAEGS